MTELRCPTCDAAVSHGHRAHRGLLINSAASIRVALLTNKEMLTNLQKKRWSKHHQAQRDKDLAAMLNLQAAIVRDEALLLQLESIEKECYGG